MTILGIPNRTENWKTALYFSPLFAGKSGRFAERLGEVPKPQSGDVKLELFWKGVRDYLYHRKLKRESAKSDLADLYVRMFPNLRKEIANFGEFQDLQSFNYDVSTDDRRYKLVINLTNTEIDVILETPNHLFIGEAKHEMTFGTDGNHILVHQLVHQYVMATILIEFSNSKKKVVPFVVGDNVESMKKTSQVRFMIRKGWLREENVLGWDEVNPSIPKN